MHRSASLSGISGHTYDIILVYYGPSPALTEISGKTHVDFSKSWFRFLVNTKIYDILNISFPQF